MKLNCLYVYGAGGTGREAAWIAECAQRTNPDHWTLSGFIEDDESVVGTVVNGHRVYSLNEVVASSPGAFFIPGIGKPTVKRVVTEKAMDAGLRLATVLHPKAEIAAFVEIGEGCLIFPQVMLSVNSRVERCSHIGPMSVVGHDVVIGEHSVLTHGVHISGCVTLGKGIYVGVGANVINGTPESRLTIGDGAVIGAGACVTRSVAPDTTVIGVPARPLK